MFDKFGEFDSYKEINKAAEGLKAEGDTKSLKELAKENGLDPDDVEDYINGKIDYLATPFTAAHGKLMIEAEDYKLKFIMIDWFNYIYTCAMDSKNEQLRLAVRKKDKSLIGCIGHILKWSNKNMEKVDDRLKKAAGITGDVRFAIPDMNTVKVLIKEYYGGGK